MSRRQERIKAAQRELRDLEQRVIAEYPADGNEAAMAAYDALVKERDRKKQAVRKMKKAAGAVFLSR